MSLPEAEWLFGPPALHHEMQMIAQGCEIPGVLVVSPAVQLISMPYLRNNVVVAIASDGSVTRLLFSDDAEETPLQ